MFEGSEKKVEIVVDPSMGSLRPLRPEWEKVVAASNAVIMSSVSNEHVDAYLLSESSLFVYDHAAVMITCGTTTLIDAVSTMLDFIPVEKVRLLVYERKNEVAPDDQPSNFEQDVARLNTKLPGTAMTLGLETGNHIRVFHYGAPGFRAPSDDLTLEILMHDLGEPTDRIFTMESGRDGIYAATRINKVLPGFDVDDFVFDPVGYSLNAVGEEAYYTVHVTPERECSYAILETNYQFKDTAELNDLVQRVLDIFKPKSASCVLYQSHGLALVTPNHYAEDRNQDASCLGYDIAFRNYVRK